MATNTGHLDIMDPMDKMCSLSFSLKPLNHLKKVSYGPLQDYSNNIKFKKNELKRLLNQIALLAVGANVILHV
jgi:hypothetical protein